MRGRIDLVPAHGRAATDVIVCCVQIASLAPCPGSTPATDWVILASKVSIALTDPI